ncbi:DUF7563 family protein [Halomarina halobia]|uniref:DUF7563 family protein n=1 Tax=Halomarina halobia TaxID=3033386 RepID=UPI003F635D36
MDWVNSVHSADSQRRCSACGAFVTQQFVRVFGDNHDEVHGCLSCLTARDLRDGKHIQDPRSAP